MSLNLVSEHLLAANGLSHQDLFSILGQLTERRLDYGDLYFQSSYHESWVLEDSIIKDGSYNIDQGVGVRAVSGEKTGFAYADQISLAALEQSAQAARTIVRDTGDGRVKTLGEVQHAALYTSIDPLQSMSREEKLDILRRVDKVARAADKRVQEVSASLTGVYELILVAATDGTLAADVRPLVRLSISVQVEDDGKRARMRGQKKPCAWRWSTCLPWRLLPVRCRWFWAQAGLACCCTKRSVTALRVISTVAGRPYSAVRWGSLSPPNCVPWWMMAPCSTVAARFLSTMKARRASTTC